MTSDEQMVLALKWFFGTGGALSGVALLIRFMIKQVTDGRIDRARGGAVADSYEQMRGENKMLREAAAQAYKERDDAIRRESEAVSRVGGLEARVMSLTEQVATLNVRVEDLMQDLQRRNGGGEQWSRR